MSADTAVIERCLRGEQAAFGFLYEGHRQAVYFLALHMVRNPEDALDLCQAAFVRAFERLSAFDLSREFRPWLFAIARNQCLDFLRRKSTRPQVAATEPEERPEASPGPLSSALADEAQQRLAEALDRLEEPHREIVLLKDFHDLSYKEIAETLDIPVGTVMSRLHAARSRLRSLLGDR